MSNTPCPICHNCGTHKLDCQNAEYVRSLTDQIAELKAENERLQAGRPMYSVCNDHPWLTATSVLGAAQLCPACQAESANALLDEVAEEAEQAQELNMGNYDEDQVRDLNNFLIVVHAILGKHEESE